MRLSMTLPTMVPGLGRANLRDWCRAIDAGPFASLAVGERIAFPNQETLVSLSMAAAWTERVRLVATVLVAPLHRTGALAKQLASLDGLSGGRLTVGLGVGGREEDYRALGVDFARRHARVDEAAEGLRRLWSGEPAAPETAPIGPEPAQPGGPPLWIGAAGPLALRRAAAWADGVAGFSLGPDGDEMKALFETALQAWQQAGRAEPPTLATSFWYALGPDPRGQLDAYVERYLGVFGSAVVEALRPRCHAAGREALREAIERARSAGAQELFLVPTSADPRQLDELGQLLGETA